MQATQSDYIAPTEWRWVLLLGSLLMLVALLPFTVVELQRPSQEVYFTGVIHDIPDAVGSVSAMRQSAQGALLPQPLYTPEPLPGILTDGLYVILGRLAALAGLDVMAVFHVARALSSLLMVHAIYLLAAVIWQRVVIRRTFSVIATLGGGLGWLFGGTLSGAPLLDTTLSPLFPFHVSLMNVHLPLAMTCLCLLASAGITALRPGSTEHPDVSNYGLRLLLFSLSLMLIDPPSLLPFAVAFAIVLGFHGLSSRLTFQRDALILLWFGVPALPLVGYLLAVWGQNPLAFALWLRDSGGPLSSYLGLMVSLGVPLILAAPGLWRVARHLEANDSALMLFWLVLMLAFGYGMPILGNAFWLGMMIPIAYFATRGVQEFWLVRVRNPVMRLRIALIVLPVLTLSHVLALLSPLAGTQPYYLDRGYAEALSWIERVSHDSVIMASPQVSLWIPALTGQRVMYATPDKTLNPIAKLGVVRAFYFTSDTAFCERILAGEFTSGGAYRVRYVVFGPRERALGAGACLEGLTPAFSAYEVRVYRHR